MSQSEHVYTAPREHSPKVIPAAVAAYLDG